MGFSQIYEPTASRPAGLPWLANGRFGSPGSFGILGIIFLPQESADRRMDSDERAEKHRDQGYPYMGAMARRLSGTCEFEGASLEKN